MAKNAREQLIATDPNPEAAKKFFALRDSGYRGPIDQDGNKVEDLDAWIEQHRPTTGGK
jgi:hypothetical protein